jgi:hypothetical protein
MNKVARTGQGTSRRRLRRTTYLLAVFLLLASGCQTRMTPPTPQVPPTTRVAGTSGSRLQYADVGDAGGEDLPSLPDIIDWMEKSKDLIDYVDQYNQCAEKGFNTSGCTAKDLAWRGVCLLLDWKLGDILVFDPGIPYGALCNGEPPLKCCKYHPVTQEYCHSAFNSEAPVNCEGNFTTPFAQSYGPCIPRNDYPGDPGCFCDYIPACGFRPVVERPLSSEWRYNQLGVKLTEAIEQGASALIRQKPADFVDYVSFVGFRAHRRVIHDGAPFAKPDEFPAGYTPGDGYHANDNVPEARYLRALTTLAVQRVFAGIPNLQGRWNAIASRQWTEEDKAAWLASIPDPEGVLEQCVGAFGVDMLRRAFPGEYLLLAAPLQGESQPACQPGWVGGAAVGMVPSVSVAVSTAGASVTLTPTVEDPDASDNPEGTYVVQIDWGDGRVEGRAYGVSAQSTHAWTHTYEVAGTYPVKARIINTSGLVGEATAQVTVVEGSGQPVPRSVESVRFELEASVTASTHGSLRVDVEATDAQGKVHTLGAHWAALTGASGTNVTLPLTTVLPNGALKDIQSLRLKPNHHDGSNVSLRLLRLWGVTLNLYASPGMQPQTRSYMLTNRDVKIYASGATAPTAPVMEPGTGKLELPLMNAEIVITLPATNEPDPAASYGCRPVYGTGAPLMRTAGGGCEDIASGLVFAVLPSQSNWRDAIWDSAVAGSPAPDEHDYGRLNDYPGGYPTVGPDTSAVSLCHDLTQGNFSDWRLPTEDELRKVASSDKAGTYFPYATAGSAWTSTSWDATYAVALHLQTGSRSYGAKATGSHRVVCVRSAPPPSEHSCLVPVDGEQLFVSGSGGCMDTRPGGLVWSRSSVPVKTWHAAIWGSELAGNAQPDAADGGRANDYADGIVPDSPDASRENHCHSLVEGGFSDWRLPTEAELRNVRGSALATKYFAFKTAESFWSAVTYSSSMALSINLDSGGTGYDEKTAYRRVVCARAPASMMAADLAPTAFTGPAAAVTRQTVSFSWTIANHGTRDAAPTWRDAIYLSRDTHPGRDDALVVDEPRSVLLAAGGSYTVTKSVTLPGVPAGNYFLLLRTDNTNGVVEKNDGNNGWTALPITVTNPDLVPITFTAPSAAAARGTVSFTWTVTNSGPATAYPSWYDNVYVSADAACCAGDTLLTSALRSTAVTPGAGYSVTRTMTLPSTLAPGSYNLILSVDRNNALAESDEGNNLALVPFTVTP